RQTMRWLGILSLTCLAAACGGGGDGGTGPNGGGQQVVGTYQLVGANETAVPTVVMSPVCTPTQITNGVLNLEADGTFQMKFNYVKEDGADYAGNHGRYKVTDDGLVFSSEDWGDQFEGGIDDGVLWIQWDFCSDNMGAELELDFQR